MKVPKSFTFRGIKLVSVQVSSEISEDTCDGCYFGPESGLDCTAIFEPSWPHITHTVPACSEYSPNFENNLKNYIFVPEESA